MAYRTEIERALNEMISDEVGNKFQGLAVVRAQQKWPRLVACERKWDGGLDAHANGALEPDGNGLGLACSTTATFKKVKRDAAKTIEHYTDMRVLIFATPEKVSEHKKGLWAKKIAEEFGLILQVISREEFVVWLLDPANSEICRDQLGITEPSAAEIDALIDQARERVDPREAKIAVYLLEQIQRTRGGNLSSWQRFRILTNLGTAKLMLEEGKIAARYYLDAAPLQPHDQKGVENEVLAYHLLLQEKETREKAASAVERFPNSTRIRSLWLQSAPQEKTYEELLDATPAFMRKDAEIASALCRKAIACGQFDRAIEHAKDAVGDKPKWSQTHLLVAGVYFARIAATERTVKPLNADDREATLAKSMSLADDAISAAEAEGVQYVKAHAFALKADIALIQGRKEDAARFAREALGAGPAELNSRLAMAESFIGMGSPDEGIRVLEEAHAQSQGAANVSFMLGQALLHRGAPQDLKRAFEVFSTANLANCLAN
jgi:tetratricopeptide (TPR) repeat protein